MPLLILRRVVPRLCIDHSCCRGVKHTWNFVSNHDRHTGCRWVIGRTLPNALRRYMHVQLVTSFARCRVVAVKRSGSCRSNPWHIFQHQTFSNEHCVRGIVHGKTMSERFLSSDISFSFRFRHTESTPGVSVMASRLPHLTLLMQLNTL